MVTFVFASGMKCITQIKETQEVRLDVCFYLNNYLNNKKFHCRTSCDKKREKIDRFDYLRCHRATRSLFDTWILWKSFSKKRWAICIHFQLKKVDLIIVFSFFFYISRSMHYHWSSKRLSLNIILNILVFLWFSINFN